MLLNLTDLSAEPLHKQIVDRLADLITYYPPTGDAVVVGLILMERFGFEGPDGRYLAVTGRFTR